MQIRARFKWVGFFNYNKFLIIMIYYKRFIKVFFVITFLYSCDKIEPPYMNNNNIGDTTQADIKQNVYVEYFTGHKCPNCPAGHQQIKDLKNLYGDRLIYVSIHSGYFANPDLNGNYTMDFTTETGNSIYDQHSVAGTPSVTVNRKEHNSSLVISPNAAASAVSDEIALKPILNIELTTSINTSNILSINADISALDNIPDKHKIAFYIVEDEIIAPQKNNNVTIGLTPDILEYNHRYVLRGSINSVWGTDLFDNAQINDFFNENNNYNIPSNWFFIKKEKDLK